MVSERTCQQDTAGPARLRVATWGPLLFLWVLCRPPLESLSTTRLLHGVALEGCCEDQFSCLLLSFSFFHLLFPGPTSPLIVPQEPLSPSCRPVPTLGIVSPEQAAVPLGCQLYTNAVVIKWKDLQQWTHVSICSRMQPAFPEQSYMGSMSAQNVLLLNHWALICATP